MRDFSKSLLTAVILGVVFQLCSSAQVMSARLAEQAKTPSNSIPLNATATVAGCITVEAVLLPRKPTAMLFSGYVADNFAVVKTTISNHCPNQQFILHNIYFDYSKWALSGVYRSTSACSSVPEAKPAAAKENASTTSAAPSSAGTGQSNTKGEAGDTTEIDTTSTPESCSNDPYVMRSRPGEVATVGALDIQDEVTEDSVFSKRNLVINGLTLVGQVAGGFAFVGSTAAAQGIGAYNSAFVPNLAKFWPDRRLDQEKFLLALGYRTDQNTAIAKDDHGSYYAFFPLATFLTPTLKKLFLDDPAVFLNPAEAWFEPNALSDTTPQSSHHGKDELSALRQVLWNLAETISAGSATSPPYTWKRLLVELSSHCVEGYCPICPKDDHACRDRVDAEKDLFAKASLNSTKIVVRGVMTIEVDSVPPTIDAVTFDNEPQCGTLWTVAPTSPAIPSEVDSAKSAAKGKGGAGKPADAASTPSSGVSDSVPAPAKGGATTPPAGQRTGEITGKFLTGSTPSIVDIAVPGVTSPVLSDYIVDRSLQVVSAKSSDTTLPFTLTLAETLPPGTKLTFQVSRTIPHTAGSSDSTSTAGTSTQVTSNKFVYTVVCSSAPAVPILTKVAIENDTKADVWQTPGKLSGTATGTNLTGGTITVSALEIAGKAATVTDYIGPIAEVPKASSTTSLDFQFTLLKAVPDGSKATFVLSTKSGDTVLASKPFDYLITKPQAANAKPAVKAATPAAKTKRSH
jgi:hypothetical protein